MKSFFMKHPVGVIFSYVSIDIFLGLIYNYLPIESKFVDNSVLLLMNIIILLFIMWLLKDKLIGSFKDFLKNIKLYIPKIIKYWSVGFVLMLIANYIINFLILGDIAPNEDANREILSMYPIYSIVRMCLIGPLMEELLFRLNFNGIKKKTTYLIVSSFLFGFMHILSSATITDLLYIVSYFILGLSFGLIYYETENVYASTLAHMLHNTLSVVIIMLGI